MLKITQSLTLMLFASGCASAVSDSAICDAISAPLTDHAAALAADGGPMSLTTGDRLVRMLDAGCAAP